MAVVSTLSNHFKYLKNTGGIDFSSDTFKIILMNTTFAFDKDADALLADVTADQLSTGNGYTQDDKSMTVSSVTENDTDDRCDVVFATVTWTASSGSIGPSGAAIIYDDTATDNPVVGCIDFGVDITATDGTDFEISSITYQDS
jgi:hypothetical protein